MIYRLSESDIKLQDNKELEFAKFLVIFAKNTILNVWVNLTPCWQNQVYGKVTGWRLNTRRINRHFDKFKRLPWEQACWAGTDNVHYRPLRSNSIHVGARCALVLIHSSPWSTSVHSSVRYSPLLSTVHSSPHSTLVQFGLKSSPVHCSLWSTPFPSQLQYTFHSLLLSTVWVHSSFWSTRITQQ